MLSPMTCLSLLLNPAAILSSTLLFILIFSIITVILTNSPLEQKGWGRIRRVHVGGQVMGLHIFSQYGHVVGVGEGFPLE